MERDDFIKRDQSKGEEKDISPVIGTDFFSHFSADIIQQVYLWLDEESQLQLSCTSTRLRSIFFKTIVAPQKSLDRKAEEARWQKQTIINFFYKYDLFFENEDALLEVPENIKKFLNIFYTLEKFSAELSKGKDAVVRIISQIEKSLNINIAQYASRLLQPKEKAETDTSDLTAMGEKKQHRESLSDRMLAIPLQFLVEIYSSTKNVNCTLVAALLANKFGSFKAIVVIADLITANKETEAMSDISQIIFNFFSMDQKARSAFLDDPLKLTHALFYQSLDSKVKNKKIQNSGLSNRIIVVLSEMQADKISYLRNIFVNLTTIFSRYNALIPKELTNFLKIIITVKEAKRLINFLLVDQVKSLTIANAKVLSLVKENELPVFFATVVQEENLKAVELLASLTPNDLTLILEIIFPYHLSEHEQIQHIKTLLDIINDNFEPIMEELTEESKDGYLIHKVAFDILICKKFMLFLFLLFGMESKIKDIAVEISTFHPKDILFLYEASTVIYSGLKNKKEFWESLREGSANKEKLLIFLEKICEFHVFPLRVYVNESVDKSLEINSTLLLGLCELLINNKILNLNAKVLENISSRDFLPIPSNKIITLRNLNFLTFTESLRLYDDKLFWICGPSTQRLLYIFGNSVENMLELFYKTARNGDFYYKILQSFPGELLELILIGVENTEELFLIIDDFSALKENLDFFNSSKIIQTNRDKFIALLSALKDSLNFFDSVKCATIIVIFGKMKANEDNKSILEIFFELNKFTMVEIISAIHITSLNISKKMTENIAIQSAEILSVLSKVKANEDIIAELFDCDNTYKIGYLHRVLVEDIAQNSMQFTQDVNEAIQLILQTSDEDIEGMEIDGLDKLVLQAVMPFTNRK